MKKKMSISVPPHIINKFDQALKLFSSGKAQEAVNLAQEVIKAVPKHADAYHLIGVILSNSGQ